MPKEKISQLSALAQLVRAELSACQATAKASDDWRDHEEVLKRLNKAVNQYALEYSKQPAA